LRFLNRRGLKRFLVLDDFHRNGKPALRTSIPITRRPAIEVDPRSNLSFIAPEARRRASGKRYC
jgi:hypothetical protein